MCWVKDGVVSVPFALDSGGLVGGAVVGDEAVIGLSAEVVGEDAAVGGNGGGEGSREGGSDGELHGLVLGSL